MARRARNAARRFAAHGRGAVGGRVRHGDEHEGARCSHARAGRHPRRPLAREALRRHDDGIACEFAGARRRRRRARREDARCADLGRTHDCRAGQGVDHGRRRARGIRAREAGAPGRWAGRTAHRRQRAGAADEDRDQPGALRADDRVLGRAPDRGEGRHRPRGRGRGDAQLGDRVADDQVPRAIRARPTGRGLVRLQHDAEGHAARARGGPRARRADADDRGVERAADGGARDGPRPLRLRGRLRRARRDGRREGIGGVMASTKPANLPVDAALALEMAEGMLRIRAFETQANQLYLSAKMPGLTHLYIGEEAVAVGVCSALRKDDTITSTHRGHGHCIAKGADVRLMYCELLGKEEGYCKGKGGSMHIADHANGNLGANAIVGGSAGIATGSGFSAKMLGSDRVSVCIFGEGALGQGLLYEVMNMAALWKLPVVYVCENNLYNEYTSFEDVTAGSIGARAEAFGIPAEQVDGQDVLAVYDAATRAVERARRGEGPSFLECRTYRYHGHHVGDVDRAYY